MATTKKKKPTEVKKKPTGVKKATTGAKKATTKASKVQAKKKTVPKSNKVSHTKVDESRSWKIASFVLVVILVALLGVAVYMYSQMNSSEEMMEHPMANEHITNENLNSSGPSGVKLTIVEDPKCLNCQVDVFAQQIKQNLISDLESEKVDVNSVQGEKFKSALDLKLVPAFLFSKEIANLPDWQAKLSGAFQEEVIGGKTYYVLNPQYVQAKYLINNIKVSNDSIVIGNPDAKLTIYEFSDYECPFCGIAEGNPELVAKFQAQSPGYVPPVPKLFEDYVDTGKVKYVYMNFPLESLHPKARSASNAALCANEQDHWREYSKMLFIKRNDWINSNDSVSVFKDFANTVGLDATQFATCLKENKYNSQIDRELQMGINLGVSGTPAFFVGKNFLSGAQDYKTFKNLIDLELSN